MEQIVGPLALGPGALAQVTFLPHSRPLQHRSRRRIPRITTGGDPVLAPPGEQVIHQQDCYAFGSPGSGSISRYPR